MRCTVSHSHTDCVLDRTFFKLNGFTNAQPASVHFKPDYPLVYQLWIVYRGLVDRLSARPSSDL